MTPVQSHGIPAGTLAIKRALFPLRGPRAQTLAFWPVDLLCAAVDGYYEAFFQCLTPPQSKAKTRENPALAFLCVPPLPPRLCVERVSP